MIDLRNVLFLLGVLLSLLAAAMLIPMGVEILFYGTEHWQSFAASSFVCGFVGTLLSVSNQTDSKMELGVREAFLLTALLWIVSCFVAALPLYFSQIKIPFTDALFESTSALTTTGATILSDLEAAPKAILLWRAILQWLGGIGIIVMAMIIFPILRIGGMQLFRSEFSDRSEKILPRVSQIASGIVGVYTGLTLLCLIFLYIAGMDLMDALCHAMGTLSTGGLSTRDASIQSFDSWQIEFIIMVFMVLGGGTLVLYVKMWQGDFSNLIKDPQYRVYLITLFVASSVLAAWHIITADANPVDSIRYSFFSVISIMTTTGYFAADYSIWGSFAGMLMLVLSMVGGCTGSTSGGIKIFRFQVLFSYAFVHLKQLRRVHGVYIPMFKGQKISETIALSVFVFVTLYVVCLMMLSLLLSFFDLSFTTAFTAAVATMGNVGVGLGKIGPAGTFAQLPEGAKLLLMFGMILGRLELLTILVLFLPNFWRD